MRRKSNRTGIPGKANSTHDCEKINKRMYLGNEDSEKKNRTRPKCRFQTRVPPSKKLFSHVIRKSSFQKKKTYMFGTLKLYSYLTATSVSNTAQTKVFILSRMQHVPIQKNSSIRLLYLPAAGVSYPAQKLSNTASVVAKKTRLLA